MPNSSRTVGRPPMRSLRAQADFASFSLPRSLASTSSGAFQIVDPKNQTAALYAWSPVGDASIAVVDDVPGVSAALPNSLSVELDSDGSAAFENTGYWGERFPLAFFLLFSSLVTLVTSS